MTDASDGKSDRFRFLFPRIVEPPEGLPAALVPLLVFPFVLVIFFCVPAVCDSNIRWFSPEKVKWVLTHKVPILFWIEWLRLSGEICLALTVGGQVFNESLRTQAKTLALRLHQEMNESYAQGSAATRQRLDELYTTMKGLLAPAKSIKTLFYNSFVFMVAARQFGKVSRSTIPRLFLRYVAVQVGHIFPGGLYGFLAYICFALVVGSKVAKFYIDRMGTI